MNFLKLTYKNLNMPSLGTHQTGTTGNFKTVIAHQNIRTYVEYRYFHEGNSTPFFQPPGVLNDSHRRAGASVGFISIVFLFIHLGNK